MIWLRWLWRNPVAQAVVAVLAALAGLKLWGKAKKKEGADEALDDAYELAVHQDRSRADHIRDAVDAARAGRLHEHDDDARGYRD